MPKKQEETFEEEDLIEYYDESGDYLKELYSLQDFLRCDETRRILLDEHTSTFYSSFSPKVIAFFTNLVKCEQEEMTSMFTKDSSKAMGELMNILFKHIGPKYDLTVFYKNPHLANPLLDEKNKIS